MTNPKVSIVIPTFNRSEFVQKAIDTSLSQTYPCEVIVCDHGSTDNTPKIMKKYGNKIKYIRRKEDFGPHFCWLEGILNAKGEFVHLQFDDDYLDDTFIQKSMELMKKDVGFVMSEGFVPGKGQAFHLKDLFKSTGIYNKKRIEKKFLDGFTYTPCASLFRKKDLIDALYQGNLPIQRGDLYHGVGPDSFISLLALLRYKKVGIILEELVFLQEHDQSISFNASININKQIKFGKAREEVINYYSFLKWFSFWEKIKYLSINFWKRRLKFKSIIFLKKSGMYSKARKYYRKLKRR